MCRYFCVPQRLFAFLRVRVGYLLHSPKTLRMIWHCWIFVERRIKAGDKCESILDKSFRYTWMQNSWVEDVLRPPKNWCKNWGWIKSNEFRSLSFQIQIGGWFQWHLWVCDFWLLRVDVFGSMLLRFDIASTISWVFSFNSYFANSMILIFWCFEKSNNASPAEILTTLIQIAYTFVTLYAACEMGQRVAYQFNLFNEKVYDCDWYLFSLEMKRIYAIALIGSQDPVIIEGYANTVCTRNAFENVIFFLRNKVTHRWCKNSMC